MTDIAGKTIGLIGALAAFPRRLAAREVTRQGGFLRRGVSRKAEIVVLGRRLIERRDEKWITARIAAEDLAGKRLVSENGFLRMLGIVPNAEAGTLSKTMLSKQSGLSERQTRLFSLFDAFLSDREPYPLRDLILARKYSGLIAGGASEHAIIRSIHRSGEIRSLTALSLHAEGSDAIYARFEESLGELDGQLVLPVEAAECDDSEDLFGAAEEAEKEHRYEEAADLYRQYLRTDPGDAVADFNRANCLRLSGSVDEAADSYLQAIKKDPDFVEAWFNYAELRKDVGDIDAARRHLERAIELDSEFADAIYNLAALEFGAGNLGEARRRWSRYLQLDEDSAWARNAERGIQYIDQLSRKDTG